jgi:hypothetical protein
VASSDALPAQALRNNIFPMFCGAHLSGYIVVADPPVPP